MQLLHGGHGFERALLVALDGMDLWSIDYSIVKIWYDDIQPGLQLPHGGHGFECALLEALDGMDLRRSIDSILCKGSERLLLISHSQAPCKLSNAFAKLHT